MAVKKATATKKAPVGKSTRKAATKPFTKGDTYECQVCGLAVVIDTECDCTEASEIICCEQPMQPQEIDEGKSKSRGKNSLWQDGPHGRRRRYLDRSVHPLEERKPQPLPCSPYPGGVGQGNRTEAALICGYFFLGYLVPPAIKHGGRNHTLLHGNYRLVM